MVSLYYWFILLHFYAFVLFLGLFSFYLQQPKTDDNNCNVGANVADKSEIYESLDPYVTAVHRLRPLASRYIKRRRLPPNISDDLSRSMYGVTRLNPKRLTALGFSDRVRSYQRQSVIYVPEISKDSRRCDLWSERRDVSYLVKCKISDGDTACFNCIESRKFVRVCVHLSRSIRLVLNYETDKTNGALAAANSKLFRHEVAESSDDFIDLPANESADEGYCLPRVLQQTVNDDNGNWRPSDKTRNCNPVTGDWLLARLGLSENFSYNWICHCRYPNLMTNASTVFSDCSRAVGCRPYGQLDDDARNGRVDPYLHGRCNCSTGYKATRDSMVGPTCVPAAVSWNGVLPQDLYKRYNLNMDSMLSWPRDRRFIDERILRYFDAKDDKLGANRSINLPNPCLYDAVTAKLMPSSRACTLVSEVINGSTVAYCVFQHPQGIPVRTERDYLRNNNGRYSNACLFIDTTHGPETNTVNTILSYNVTTDRYNPRPDFGCLYAGSNQLRKIISDLMAVDSEHWLYFNAFTKEPVSVNRSIKSSNIVVASGSLHGWFSAYEQIPLESASLFGLKESLLRQYASQKNGGVIFNLRKREVLWYNRTNPLGNVHWEQGPAEDWNNHFSQWSPQMYNDSAAWLIHSDDIKPAGFKVEGNNACMRCFSEEPILYPAKAALVPFTGGSAIDDERFSVEYFPTLMPIYRQRTATRPNNTVVMPFVFNTRYDHFDSTITLHQVTEGTVYIMAEQLVGKYKNHDRLLYNKMQSDWV